VGWNGQGCGSFDEVTGEDDGLSLRAEFWGATLAKSPQKAGQMNRATPQTRSVAKRLMVIETGGNNSSVADATAAFPVTAKLYPHLANLMGQGGVRALFARALQLATAEIPWLRGLHVKAGGDLEGLAALRRQVDRGEFLEGEVVVLAHLLELLVAFIGPNLTSRLLGEIWPQIPPKQRNFGKEHKREKAK